MHEYSHETAPRTTVPAARRGPAPPQLAAPLLRLQRSHGNAYVRRLLAQRACAECAGGGDVDAAVAGRIDRARGGGAGLDAGVRGSMEDAFGADFGHVRVHTGSEAHALNGALGARAFTTGSDVFFADGEYAPGSAAGRELIAHELTHVVQQGAGAGSPVQGKLVLGPADDAYEREADTVARAVVAGESAPGVEPVSAARVQRQETSNPPEMEEELRRLGSVQAKRSTSTAVTGRVSRAVVQRRGGATVGQLSVATNVVSAGLIAGHAWLIYTPTGGATTTYGTWGNRAPIGLHRDIELAYHAAASRTTDLDATDHAALTAFAGANNAWSYTNNCASFAARGWMTVTGETISYTTAFIPNPSALGAGIVAKNGGAVGVLAVGPPGSSSGPRSSTGTPSAASSSAGSSA